MSAFENFIQIELPKRPYLSVDAAQETVMVRRGPGPRQLAPVVLAEGEVLAFLNGELVGTTVSTLSGFQKMVVPVTTAAQTWNVNHAFNTTDVIMQVTDDNGFIMLADSMQIVDTSNIQITFAAPQSGTLRMIFML